MDAESSALPEGFRHFPNGLGFNDLAGPFAVKRSAEAICVGLRVEQKHCNMLGICHGGVLMTLADVAMAFSIGHHLNRFGAGPTLGLQVDFINAAKRGDWLEARLQTPLIRGSIAYTICQLERDSEPVLRAQATYRILDKPALAETPDWLRAED